LGDHVIVVLEGTAYEIREGDAEPLDVPASQPTPAEESTRTPVPTTGSAAQPAVEPGEGIPQSLSEAIAQLAATLIDMVAGFFGE
jgi:hypothetical protein